MEKYNSYLCLSANLDRIVTTDDVTALKSALHGMGFYKLNLNFSVGPTDTPDTPDTSTYTEKAYPAPAEEPEQPKEEPKEEPAPANTVTKDELRYTLMKFRDAFGKEALRDLYERLGNGAHHLTELSEDCYGAMCAEANKKLGEQNA